jgi:acylphosphatase
MGAMAQAADAGGTAIDLVVTGHVQGVFFRASMREEAERLGVTGWVRNEPDGSVAAHLEGPADAVAALVEWSSQGPPRARVEEVRRTDAELTDAVSFASD